MSLVGQLRDIEGHIVAMSEFLPPKPDLQIRRHDYPSYFQAAIARTLAGRPRDALVRAYEFRVAFEIDTLLDLRRLDYAFQRVVTKHSEMRSIFWTNSNDVRVEWLEVGEFHIQVIRVEGMSSEDVHTLVRERSAIGWTKLTEPLVRLSAFVGASSTVLSLEIHHLVGDGWSMELVLRDLISAYLGSDIVTAQDATPTFEDFVDWEQEFVESEAGHRQFEYWKQVLSNIGPTLALPLDQPRRSNLIGAAKDRLFEFGPEATTAMKSLSDANGTTVFTILASGWALALSSLTAATDLPIQVSVSRRARAKFQEVVGLFAQSACLRISVDPAESSSDFIRRVTQDVVLLLDNQDYPLPHFERTVGLRFLPAADGSLQSAYRQIGFSTVSHNRNDPFGLAPLLQDASGRSINLGGFQARAVDVDFAVGIGSLAIDLWPQLIIGPTQIRGWLRHNRDIFDPGTAERIASTFTAVTTRMVQEPGTPIGKLL